MGKKLTIKEIEENTKDINQGFDTCCVCGEVELKGNMLEVNPNSNNWDLICTECNNAVNDIKDLYPYPYSISKTQFDKPIDHTFAMNENVSKRKNIYVIQTKTYHEILRDYHNIHFKVGSNVNQGDKQFDTLEQAESFAKLISSTNTYSSYYVVSNKNGLFYVIGTDEYNTQDIGTIVSKEFYDYELKEGKKNE